MQIRRFLTIGCLVPLLAMSTEYEVIEIPVGEQGAQYANLPRPERGMSSAAVLMRFGAPLSKTPPVGKPPISRWHYHHFTVYFEGDTVIDSVLPHTPVHPVPE
jgi:hypothetical protein